MHYGLDPLELILTLRLAECRGDVVMRDIKATISLETLSEAIEGIKGFLYASGFTHEQLKDYFIDEESE